MSRDRSRRTVQRRRAPPRQGRGLSSGWLVALGGGLAFVVAIILVAVLRPPQPPDGVESFEVPSANHVPGTVTYAQTPPVGGDHAQQWQNCGFYSGRIANENAVHSMEHGAVWITYKQDIQQDQTHRIRQLAAGQTHVLASSYPDLPSPVIVSAWGRQLRLDSAEDPRLEQFIKYFKQGPTTPEPGAPCSGGVGSPR
jgi:hypothetical protein